VDKLALEQYDKFNAHRLELEANAEILADDEELKRIEKTVITKKLPKKKKRKNGGE